MKDLLYFSLIASLIGFSSCSKDDDDNETIPTTPPSTSTFCYNFNNTVATYDTIQGGTAINTVNNDGFYEVDLGFSFNLCDRNFTKLFIESDYYSTTFTYEVSPNNIDLRKYYVLANGDLDLEPKYDSNFELATRLVKSTTGTSGNKVTTIEFRELHYYNFDEQEYYTVNYKIIFREIDNSVSYHYGPNDLKVNFTQDQFTQFAIGLYSNMEADGLFLKGDPSSPNAISNGYLSELNTWPLENTLYKFTKK